MIRAAAAAIHSLAEGFRNDIYVKVCRAAEGHLNTKKRGKHRMMTVEQRLRGIVKETFLVGAEGEDLSGDDSFIEQGIIDSTGILQLVEFVEQEFGLKVADEDLIPENLDSINRLVAFVEKKRLLASIGSGESVSHSSTEASPVGAASPGAD